MRCLAPFAVMALALVPVGCRKAPEPTVQPTAEAVAQWPTLEVLTSVVQYRAQETDDLSPVEAGTTLEEVTAGGNVVTSDGGRAILAWPDFLSVEMLTGTDALLGLSIPSQREVVVDQATGVARYALQGAGEPATVTVKAAFVTLNVDAGTADFVVALVPGQEPVAWLAVLDGEATVTRDKTGDTLTVGAGQATGFTEEGKLSVVLDVDRAAVLAWLEDYADGTTDTTIASVALRCEALSEVQLVAEPEEGAEAVGGPIAEGDVVTVDGRSEDASWLWVRPLAGRDSGWAPADAMRCTGPVLQAALSQASEKATPTPPPPTRAVIFVTATPAALATVTPSATPTGSAYTIRFWADDDSIDQGECTVLRWETSNISQVYYEGKGVVGNGSSEECPEDDETFELKVILRDGSTQVRTVTIEVEEEEAPTAAPSTATSEPPTAEPTTEPTAEQSPAAP
jgi:hypothetical protein